MERVLGAGRSPAGAATQMLLMVLVVLAGLLGCGPPSRPSGDLRIATGAPGGVYYAYGEGLAGVVRSRLPGLEPEVLRTAASLEADLNHDTTGRLNEISASSLIIGGSEDPFFSESLLCESAQKIPDATLHVYEGVGHGVPKERKRRYENDTLAFLDDRLGGSSDRVRQTMSSRVKEMR
jgi:pimeloyl-ACP methyl ester carboxylesterase